MVYLLDKNMMWRRFHEGEPNYISVKRTIDGLLRRGENVCITAQNLIEFQSVATRPFDVNGLGLSTVEASRKADEMKAMFAFLPDTPAIFNYWPHLVDRHEVVGRQVHDARLVAVMLAYDVTHLITLNPTHFRRFDEITVVEPV